jgi:RNA polymerase sigma-70 factor (ECF subfamily)
MDSDGYRTTVLAIKDRIFSYSAYLLRDAEEAKDVAQEALVRLWEHRQVVPDLPSARAWTLRTAHNLAMDRLRQRRARPDDGEDALGHLADGNEPGPERSVAGREAVRELVAALGELAAQDRAVLVMREVQSMSYQEMTRALDLPLGTVKARLHRARERLRERLVRAGVTP